MNLPPNATQNCWGTVFIITAFIYFSRLNTRFCCARLCYPCYPSFFARSSARRWVYRRSICQVLCPLMVATSGNVRPLSKNRDMASCRRSWKRRSSIPARVQAREKACVKDPALTPNTDPSIRRGIFFNIATALVDNGTVLASSVFVSGINTARVARLIFVQRIDAISDRRIPVSTANATACRAITLWLNASSSLISSSADILLSRPRGSFGMRIWDTGLPFGIAIPQSLMAVLITRDKTDNSCLTDWGPTSRNRTSR